MPAVAPRSGLCRTRPPGCAGPAATMPAAGRCRPPRSTPAAMARSARAVPAADPPIDCFYVYPTVSRDPGDNSDHDVPGSRSRAVAAVQFARFATLCRPYAPLYRQATLTALQKAMSGRPTDSPAIFGLAYGDVAAAWRHYLENDNKGRPFVLIGHSQGSIMLVDACSPARSRASPRRRACSRRCCSASISRCRKGNWSAGRSRRRPCAAGSARPAASSPTSPSGPRSTPPVGALFGRAAGAGNDRRLHQSGARSRAGSAPLDSYWYAGPSLIASARARSPGRRRARRRLRSCAPRASSSGDCVNRRAARLSRDERQRRSRTTPVPTRIPGDVMVGGSAPAGLGHAPCRHEFRDGRPHASDRGSGRGVSGKPGASLIGAGSARKSIAKSDRPGPFFLPCESPMVRARTRTGNGDPGHCRRESGR